MNTEARLAAVVAAVANTMLLAIGVGCGGTSAQPQKPAAAGPPTINVVHVLQQPVNVILTMPGQLDPYETVAVYPKVTGFVKTITVDRGSHVKTGELLAQLEAPELVAQRAEAHSKVQAAEAQLAAARAKADADGSTFDKLTVASATPGAVAGNDLVVAQKTVDADRSEVSAAQETADAARQALQAVSEMQGYLRVTAPFDGVVTERNVHPGALVGPNSGAGPPTPMVRVVKSDRLRLVVPVPEAYIAGVSNGTVLAFSVPAYPGRSFSGQIARVADDVDVKTRTMAVELDVANADGALTPGTFCQVQWPIHRPQPSLFVPNGSIASTTDRTFVVRVRDGTVEWIDVKTGLAAGSLTEVFGDLKPGDAVAVRGSDEIRPGAIVRATEAKVGSS